MLRSGEEAPDFTLPDQHGDRLRLSDLRGKWVVLYFYPKDETTGCTAQACAFRDDLKAFEDLDAEVVGVSVQSVESHQAFAENHDLNFRILADEAKGVSRLYETLGLLGVSRRITYVINPEGRIVEAYRSEMRPRSHVEVARQVLQERAAAS